MKKTFVIYPLVIYPRNFTFVPKCFVDKTKIDDVIVNEVIITWRNDRKSYSIITDSIDTNKKLIYGRLLKLRKGAISQIGPDAQQKLKEEVIASKPGQYLLEPAYFIFDYSNNIILGQYTTDSVNVLSSRPKAIFNKIFEKCLNNQNVDLSVIPTKELIKTMLNKGPIINQFKARLNNIDLEYARDKLGLSDSAITKLMAEGKTEFTIDMKFKHGRPKFTEKTFEFLKKGFRKEDNHSESVKIYTENGNFDIIKDNLIYYEFEQEIDTSREIGDDYYRELIKEIHSKIEEKLDSNLATIKDSIGKRKTLEDYSEDV
jgi:hypothetical protein